MMTVSEVNLLDDEFVEALVRRYYNRPGARFVDIRPVGIPIHVLKLFVVCTAKRALPPINEFVLKSIDSRIASQKEIAAFLGLSERTVEKALLELYGTEVISLLPLGPDVPDVENPEFKLTQKGGDLVKTLVRTTIEETVIDDVAIHGFTRKPLRLDARGLLTATELEQFGMLELPALPKMAPSVDQIDPDELQCATSQNDDVKVIGVRAVLKPRRIRFQPAYMIQYESAGGLRNRGAQFVFITMDGREDKLVEKAFQQRGGPDRIDHMMSFSQSRTQVAVSEFLTEEQAARLPDTSESEKLKEEINSLEASLVDDVPDTPVKSRTAELREQNQALESKIEELKKLLAEQPAQMLRTYECGKILNEAIANAKQKLLIVSAFLSRQVVNASFIERLEGCLKRGVQVWIGFGFGDGGKRERYDWTDAEDALKQLRKRYKKQFILHDLKNSHEKILIVDDAYVVVGSYNWLSFQQDKNSKYRRENAVQVRQAQTVKEYWDEFLTAITAK
ncbi:MAG: phospholipase D-like domain-containing protein [Fuerstiella sp.]